MAKTMNASGEQTKQKKIDFKIASRYITVTEFVIRGPFIKYRWFVTILNAVLMR